MVGTGLREVLRREGDEEQGPNDNEIEDSLEERVEGGCGRGQVERGGVEEVKGEL